MNTDLNAVSGITSQSSLLDAFGEYYRNRKSGNNTSLLKSIFEEADNKIKAGKIAKNKSIFEVNNKSVTAAKRTKILKRAAKPKVLNVLKNIHKLGRRGGYAALAIGAAIGLFMLYQRHNDNSKQTIL